MKPTPIPTPAITNVDTTMASSFDAVEEHIGFEVWEIALMAIGVCVATAVLCGTVCLCANRRKRDSPTTAEVQMADVVDGVETKQSANADVSEVQLSEVSVAGDRGLPDT